MPSGRRQLFVYWNLDSADLDSALHAAQAMQRVLRDMVPGLRCGLYRRRDGTTAQATLMEIYAIAADVAPDGISPALRQRIEIGAEAALSRWLRGRRHVEVFDVCAE
jgi:hypothetical protein